MCVCVCALCASLLKVRSEFIVSVFSVVFFTLFTASGRHDVLHSGRTCQTRGLRWLEGSAFENMLCPPVVRTDDLHLDDVVLPSGLGSPGAGSGRSRHDAWRHGGAGPGEGLRRRHDEDMTISYDIGRYLASSDVIVTYCEISSDTKQGNTIRK